MRHCRWDRSVIRPVSWSLPQGRATRDVDGNSRAYEHRCEQWCRANLVSRRRRHLAGPWGWSSSVRPSSSWGRHRSVPVRPRSARQRLHSRVDLTRALHPEDDAGHSRYRQRCAQGVVEEAQILVLGGGVQVAASFIAESVKHSEGIDWHYAISQQVNAALESLMVRPVKYIILPDSPAHDAEAKKNFKKVVKYKPLSSKKESKEIYIYCKGILKIWYIMQQYSK